MHRTDDTGGAARAEAAEWWDTFGLELRLAGMSGAQIGDAIAVVEEHCADSGESPPEAFGDPADYAKALAADQVTSEHASDMRTSEVIGSIAGLLAPVLAGWAAWAGFAGEPVRITAGALVMIGALTLCVVVLVRHFEAVVRRLVGPGWYRPVLLALVPVALFSAMLLLLPQVLVELPWWPAAVAAGVAVIIASATLVTGGGGDPIRDPRREGADRQPRMRLASAAFFPLLTLLVVALVWLLHAVA